MSIFVDESTRVCVQGITGRDGSFHTGAMIEYGTHVVAGVTPGKGGQTAQGVPVFNTVAEAVARDRRERDDHLRSRAVRGRRRDLEAAEAGVDLVVCITEGVPTLDASPGSTSGSENSGTRMIGPNCPGSSAPGRPRSGSCRARSTRGDRSASSRGAGRSPTRSSTSSAAAGSASRPCIGIGGDPIIGTNFIDALTAFEEDAETEAVVLIGEIGGTDEEQAAEFVVEHLTSRSSVSSRGGRRRPGREWATRAPSLPAAKARPRTR